MTDSCGRAGMLLLAGALMACGADTTDEPATGQVASTEIRACSLLDLASATRVLGPGTELPGGDTEPLSCMYSNAGVGMLTVQLNPASSYDQVTILPPHTPADIGDQGRYNVQANGVVSVQFADGAHSATLSVQPIGTTDTDFLQPMLTAAREMAAKLP